MPPKDAFRTFFSAHGKNIKPLIQAYANQHRALPGLNQFKAIVNNYAERIITNQENSRLVISYVTNERTPGHAELMREYLGVLTKGITIPRPPPPPPAAPPLIRPDGAILANGSVGAKAAAARTAYIFDDNDAVKCVNVNGMRDSTLIGETSVGTFYHQTVQFNNGTYGVSNNGKNMVTLIYVRDNGHYYFVGLGKHDGTDNRDKSKYLVQATLVPLLLHTGDTLRFT